MSALFTAAALSQPLVQARRVFDTPRAEKAAAYFGEITDASGRHRPPGRPPMRRRSSRSDTLVGRRSV